MELDRIKLEVCIDSVESALALVQVSSSHPYGPTQIIDLTALFKWAVRGGADRLEICGNLAIIGGGTTPSLGLVRLVKKSCPSHIELMTMIRPRTGDFLYTSHELSVMLEDICAFAETGITGVVFGALYADGKVDMEKTEILTKEAVKYNLQVCFHRAFDVVVNQKDSLHALSTIPGITRILTSGGKPTVSEGLASLVNLCTSLENQNRTPESSTILASSPPLPQRQTHLEIMPGSGLNAQTLLPILYVLRPLVSSGVIRSIHMSGGGFVENGVLHRPEGMGMGVGGAGEWGIWRTSEQKVRTVREVVDKMWEEIVKERGVKSE